MRSLEVGGEGGAKNDEFQLRYTNKQTIPYYLSKLITFDFACLFASLNATKWEISVDPLCSSERKIWEIIEICQYIQTNDRF